MHNNAHSKSAGAYGTVTPDMDQRTMEGTILLKAAQKLETLADRLREGEKVRLEEIGDILNHNQKLWQLFVSDMNNPDHPVPQEIRNNIASLALFVFISAAMLWIRRELVRMEREIA